MLVAVSILQKAEKPNLDQPSIMHFDLHDYSHAKSSAHHLTLSWTGASVLSRTQISVAF